jgi:6-pyruvoyl-tetrahydropterin synthase
MVMDFADMKRILRESLADFDHRSWNDFLEYLPSKHMPAAASAASESIRSSVQSSRLGRRREMGGTLKGTE